jgi:hypothetical protein
MVVEKTYRGSVERLQAFSHSHDILVVEVERRRKGFEGDMYIA